MEWVSISEAQKELARRGDSISEVMVGKWSKAKGLEMRKDGRRKLIRLTDLMASRSRDLGIKYPDPAAETVQPSTATAAAPAPETTAPVAVIQTSTGKAEAEERLAIARAEKAEIELAKARGTLIEAAIAEKAVLGLIGEAHATDNAQDQHLARKMLIAAGITPTPQQIAAADQVWQTVKTEKYERLAKAFRKFAQRLSPQTPDQPHTATAAA